MNLKPIIRDNIALNASSEGCYENILNFKKFAEAHEPIHDKPLNVLVIGGSSGYGLASRCLFAFNNKAQVTSISFERAPRNKSTGSAGYYNNQAFVDLSESMNLPTIDINADCFSHETKSQIVDLYKEMGQKIDCVIYSVASGIRIHPDTQEKIVSTLKPIGKNFEGYTVDIAKDALRRDVLSPATNEEIENTTRVMGGEDYLLWIEALHQGGVLQEECKAITYTYVGSPITYPIYKDGTIGYAKRDLEHTNSKIQKILDHYQGEALISASKTVVTKASVFIPTVTLYASALFKVMKDQQTHESLIEHKYRLFKDMVYGSKRLSDETGMLRIDAYELDQTVQTAVQDIMNQITPENFQDITDYESFKKEFLAINGF